ncbi:hypothetical protein [Providencia sp. PROV033]|uniref:hypothetical protein n=1 Tax=Providencia sp. PROV033 TaxID=2949765 RepID=UPI00234A3E92|nr:hypothetical protein [Providencia sp. PROV033]
MATLIDTLLVSLKLDSGGFANDAKKATTENDKLADSIDALNETLGGVNETLKGTREQQKKAKEQSDSFTKSINNATKALAGLFTTIFMSTGLTKLIEDTARSNDQLNFLSKNLGMNATQVKRWQGAAELSGGSAEGMASSMANLNKSLWDLVTVGDTSILPYFNALNVGVVKNNGELRNLDDILLDVADSLSQMSRPQAYNFAKNMGFDEGTINMLLQGRQEMERQLALQKDIVVSSEQELEISRQLQQQNALVGMQWDGLKTLLGNYLIPYALKLSATVTGFLGYLNKNRDTAIFLFKALGTVIGVTLIPIVLKAATAFVGLFGAIGLLPALLLLLGASLWLLYDDFKKWKEGGESLLGEYWEKWDSTITPILEKLDEMGDWFIKSDFSRWSRDIDRIKKSFDSIKDSVSSLTGKLLELIGIDPSKFSADWVFDKIIAGVRRASETLALLLDALNKLTDGDFSGAYDSLAGAATTLITGEKDGSIFNAIYGEPTNKYIEEHKANKALAYSGMFGGLREILGLPSASSDSFTATSVEVPSQNKRIYKTDKGDVVREDGSRAWRNNNPSNMIWGEAARKQGAIGHDTNAQGHTMAIFPNRETGDKARRWLLFESDGGKQLSTKGDYGAGIGYQNKTVAQALTAHSPPEAGNDTAAYIRSALAALGSTDLRMGDLTPAQRDALIAVIDQKEGQQKGKEYYVNQANALNNIKSFNKQISTPFAAGVGDLAKGFLDQSNALKSQAQTITNNKTDVNVAGITVNTNASTLSGVSEAAAEESIKRVYQLVPSIS